MERRATHVVWHHGLVERPERERLLRQRGCVLWFTGLSGSGKSTVAREVERQLLQDHRFAAVLDGDNLRHGLNADLGFTPADRTENIRRVSAVAQILAESGAICLAAFVSPYRADRDAARSLLDPGRFLEVFVDTPLEICEARDPKGLYSKARAGEIPNFTGISAPYEAPLNPEVHLRTEGRSAVDCAREVLRAMVERDLVTS